MAGWGAGVLGLLARSAMQMDPPTDSFVRSPLPGVPIVLLGLTAFAVAVLVTACHGIATCGPDAPVLRVEVAQGLQHGELTTDGACATARCARSRSAISCFEWWSELLGHPGDTCTATLRFDDRDSMSQTVVLVWDHECDELETLDIQFDGP